MNVKRFIAAFIFSFVFIFTFNWLFHGVLLMETYKATAELWRPMAEEPTFTQYCAVMMASQLFMAFMLAFLFTRHYEGKGVAEGVRYGLYVGLLLAAIDLGKYSYMPVEFTLVGTWMLGSLLTALGTGVVLSLVYRK